MTEQMGRYKILNTLAKGGMGEILLAFDTKLERKLAIKKIREDLLKHTPLHKRFLREIKITSQLTHPAILPIYTIEEDNGAIYYTMPFIQGETLKNILRRTRKQQKEGMKLDYLGESIPALVNIFISVCQAIAYSHSKGFLHRDIKPENIIYGKFGEVFILDWGLAQKYGEAEILDDETLTQETPQTRIGKVVGTLNYLAPERVKKKPADPRTDVYALGVVLYQILTLKNPFVRKDLASFRKIAGHESVLNPIEAAPYRDIPPMLARVVLKCLDNNPDKRYQTVEHLIHDIQNFIEGRSEWTRVKELDLRRKSDWEFQENILIAEHIAISRSPDSSDWVSMMVSRASFPGNSKLEAEVTIHEEGHGVGFFISIPEQDERSHINDGYCLWLGSDQNKTTKLLRRNIEVIQAPEICLQRGKSYKVRIEKIENNIYFYLDNTLQFSYITYLPLIGTHVGLLSRDDHFSLHNFSVSLASQNVTVNCLAIPDALLAHKNFSGALAEYRRIAYSFPGRFEAREALFRAGVTLLEKGRIAKNQEEKQADFEEALTAFEELHTTAGAPLEYLGKSLVYYAWDQFDEEIKCFELAFRRFAYHPQLTILKEQLLYRMHESSRKERKVTYHFVLLMLIYFPEALNEVHVQKLLQSLKRHWEPLPFLEERQSAGLRYTFSLPICYSLHKVYLLEEMFLELYKTNQETSASILFCLLRLNENTTIQSLLNKVEPENLEHEAYLYLLPLLAEDALSKKTLDTFPENMSFYLDRSLLFLSEKALFSNIPLSVEAIYKHPITLHMHDEHKITLHAYYIWSLLLQNEWESAYKELSRYPHSILQKEGHLLHLLYGCWLIATEGIDIAHIHFSALLEIPYPRSYKLLAHWIHGRFHENSRWYKNAFFWEKASLFRQLALYYHCVGDKALQDKYQAQAFFCEKNTSE